MTENEWKLTRDVLLLRKALLESEGARLQLAHAVIERDIAAHGSEYVPEVE